MENNTEYKEESLEALLQEQKSIAEKIARVKEAKKQEALKEIHRLIALHEVTVEEAFGRGVKSSGKGAFKRSGDARSVVPPKYRNPATGETWTGRGKAPKWIEGKNREEYLISA